MDIELGFQEEKENYIANNTEVKIKISHILGAHRRNSFRIDIIKAKLTEKKRIIWFKPCTLRNCITYTSKKLKVFSLLDNSPHMLLKKGQLRITMVLGPSPMESIM